MPTLYLELSEPDSLHMYALAILSDSQSLPQQANILFELGIDEGRKALGQKMVSVTMTSEAWVSKSHNLGHAMNPGTDPGREEILIVETWIEASQRSTLYSMSIVRDPGGQIVEVGEPVSRRGRGDTKASMNVESFCRGFRMAPLPDAEVSSGIDKIIQDMLRKLM